MSICSGVTITREEARKRVKSMLMYQQERLIDLAINAMNDFDLVCEISNDMYSYTIEKTKPKKEQK